MFFQVCARVFPQMTGLSLCFLTGLSYLSSPNDGVVEKERARLPFGNHVSDAPGECHFDLSFLPLCWYPSQTDNKQRNQEMDREAAR